MLKSAVLVLLLAAAPPAHAADWFYVDAARNHSSISFVDRDEIKVNADGHTLASIFSVFATDQQGAAAFRIGVEIDCAGQRSRALLEEAFDSRLASTGVNAIPGEWEPVDPGTQGATLAAFICSKGANPLGPSLGAALPFEKGRAMLAEHRAKGAQ